MRRGPLVSSRARRGSTGLALVLGGGREAVVVLQVVQVGQGRLSMLGEIGLFALEAKPFESKPAWGWGYVS